MAIPIFEKFLYPFLVVVDAHSLSSKEIREAVAIALGLSDDDRALTTKSGKKLQYVDRVDWSLQYLRRAGMVEADGSKWKSTKRGHDYLKNHTDLTRDDLMQYPEFISFVSGTTTSTTPLISKNNEVLTPSEQFEAAYQNIKDKLASDLLDILKDNPPVTPKLFEKIVVDLMISMGYGTGHTTQYSKDGGVDGIIYQDQLGLDKIYIQAKQWKDNKVGRPEIQKFIGAIATQGATKGVFFTTSSFTDEAIECIEKAPQKVILIDGNKLANLMIDHDLGVYSNPKETYTIKYIDKDYFEE